MVHRTKWILVIVLIFLVSACGNGDRTPPTAAPDQQIDTQQDTSDDTDTDPQTVSVSNLLCENPSPMELGLGDSIDGTIEDPRWNQCYWVILPDGLDTITFELSGLSADLHLNVGFGFLVTLQYHTGEFWQSNESGEADEFVIIEKPAPGPYFIDVGPAGLKEPSPFTLSIRSDPPTNTPASGSVLPETDSCAFPAVTLELDAALESEVVGSDRDPLPRGYFCVQVPDGLTNLRIEITGLLGDLDLFVRRTSPAEWLERNRGVSEKTVSIENPQTGAYFIDIASAYPGAGSPFTLLVQGE